MFAIRPYHPSDFTALYRVCLLTGDSGKDASQIYRDPELLGHIYVGPYVVYEPDLCFTLTNKGVPCGYVLGARDTLAFHTRCEADWYPVLRARYPLPAPEDASPDAGLIRHIHTAWQPNPDAADYPAHLHIDLLPEAQGQGMGRKMIETLLNRLREVGAPAVHLGVSAQNTRAIQFYAHVGFHQVKASTSGILFGMHLF
jgi:GNAT superfamily N-acetyltransferase